MAAALNTLELLAAEKASTAAESVEAIHSAVALPVDEILNDAVNVMERYIGHEPEVVERLAAHPAQRPRHQAGDPEGRPEDGPRRRPSRSRRRSKSGRCCAAGGILVVDADENVRSAAHALLERYGCVVETAPDGAEALFMVRADRGGYDVIIADIRLPDMTGYEFMLKLQERDGCRARAAGADDRLRLRSRPLDRQGPAGRPASPCSTSRSASTSC